MIADTEMKIRGLCETLASACSSAAACHRALARALPTDHPYQEIHSSCAEVFEGYDANQMAANHISALLAGDMLAALTTGDLDAAWPDAIERPAGEAI